MGLFRNSSRESSSGEGFDLKEDVVAVNELNDSFIGERDDESPDGVNSCLRSRSLYDKLVGSMRVACEMGLALPHFLIGTFLDFFGGERLGTDRKWPCLRLMRKFAPRPWGMEPWGDVLRSMEDERANSEDAPIRNEGFSPRDPGLEWCKAGITAT